MGTKVNYTDEMVAKATEMYQEQHEAGTVDMDAIAEAVGRTVRSVRAKLVREGVYVAPVKPDAQPKDEGPTKKELLMELEALVSFDVTGLMGATKPVIADIIALATVEGEDQTD